jgi:propionyl-CoA carboxylase alpha chain
MAGQELCMQIERDGIGYQLRHGGLQVKALVLSSQAAEYYSLMPLKPPPDLSKFLISPMPGLLLQLLVAAGDAVDTGQPLAVIEAMKMENVLRAEQAGTVAKLLAAEGDSLAVDQPLIEFA